MLRAMVNAPALFGPLRGRVMTSVSLLQSGAALMLQQMNRSLVPASVGSGFVSSEGLIAAASAVSAANVFTAGGPFVQAKAKISDAIFSANAPSITEMKIHLMKRLGEEVGVALEDYETHASFGSAVADRIDEIKKEPQGVLMISALEKKLGFDKLGFSLDTFVNAIIDPKGSDGERVDAALKKHLDLEGREEEKPDAARRGLDAFRLDESGLYGFANS